MPVTQHSPHRSRRAALPHRAPASGDHGQAPGEACRTRARTCDREPPALRPAPGLRDHVPLGPRPALHRRRPSHGATGVRRLPRSSAAVRRPAPGPHGRLPAGAPCGPGQPAPGRCRASRVPRHGLRACQRSPTPPGLPTPRPPGVSRLAFRVCGARRPPGVARLRGARLCQHVPLSTLRVFRDRKPHLPRGQCGWLDLHWQGLAPFNTSPAFPGAPERCGSAVPGSRSVA